MPEYQLHHGDCLDVLATLEGLDAVVTDPPYSSGGAFRGDRMQSVVTKYVQSGAVETCRSPFTGDNRDQRSFLVWCTLWMSAARAACVPGAPIVVFTDWRQLPTITDAIQCAGWIWRGVGTWWKPGIRMQRGRFSASAEYVVYGSNGPVNEGESSPQNVFSFAPVRGKDKEHIAEKPVEVMAWAMSVAPAAGTILDPFVGSGASGVAAMRSGRGYVGIEVDRESFRVAASRIEHERAKTPMFADAG